MAVSPVEARTLCLNYAAWEVLASAIERVGPGRGTIRAASDIRDMLSRMSRSPRPAVVSLEVRVYRSVWPEVVSFLTVRGPVLDRLGANHQEWSPYAGVWRKGEAVASASYDALYAVREYPVPRFDEEGQRV